MQLVVIGNAETQKEFENKGIPDTVQVQFTTSIKEALSNADAIFYLLPEDKLQDDLAKLSNPHLPVFVNAVITTSGELPSNAIRINAWPGFLQRSVTELCASDDNMVFTNKIFDALGWKFQLVPDEPGMIAVRIIAMIINEAYFALGDEVSTKADIDTAMRLGTNYPYGPFEWSEKIGLKNVRNLLQQLALTDDRYTPSPALLKEIPV